MSRVRAFFVEEASECLNVLQSELSGPSPDPAVLYRAVRKLRGSAQVARFGALAEEARSLETALKPVAGDDAAWDGRLKERVVDSTELLERGVDAVRDGRMEQDEREPAMDEQDRNEVATDEVVPIETLEYRGEAALERAEALREPLEEAIAAGDPPEGIIDELFDLIRLGAK